MEFFEWGNGETLDSQRTNTNQLDLKITNETEQPYEENS